MSSAAKKSAFVKRLDVNARTIQTQKVVFDDGQKEIFVCLVNDGRIVVPANELFALCTGGTISLYKIMQKCASGIKRHDLFKAYTKILRKDTLAKTRYFCTYHGALRTLTQFRKVAKSQEIRDEVDVMLDYLSQIFSVYRN